jgi:2-C-methyl-D-erythritol 4-phosphate cytidylyltransferase
MVEWTLEAFRQAPSVHSIVVACPPGHVHDLDGEGLRTVPGGATRARSVRNALDAVATELVAIHDAARPLVTAELVEEVVEALAADTQADAAIVATPVVDTIKRASAQGSSDPDRRSATSSAQGRTKSPIVIRETVDREALWAAQTPQVFRTASLRAALDAYSAEAPEPTDEAMLIEAAGGRVLIHPGGPENLKVTTPLDLRIAELLLADRAR